MSRDGSTTIPFGDRQGRPRRATASRSGQRGPTPHTAGFTLLEVMIAVAVIGLALTALLGLQSRSISLANEAKFASTASLLAQSRMAHMELEKPDRLVDAAGDFGDKFPGYQWEVTVADVHVEEMEGLADHLKQIDVVVSWGTGARYRYPLRLFRFVE